MPKHYVSGLCNNTNENGYSTDTWPKDSKVARKWDRFVELDVTKLEAIVIPQKFRVVVTSDNLIILYLMISGDINSVFTPSLFPE